MHFDPLTFARRLLTWFAGISAVTLLMASGIAERADDALYDFHMRYWSYPASDNVVIVAIDPQSLAKIGNWPWPRSVHAKLIDRLTSAGVRGVGIDITMAEADADHPDDDLAVAQAIGRNGHVVMPVFAEATELGGVLEEMLPAPVIAHDAAAFGHVDASKDPDGVTRGVYLKAGLGQPHWSALALSLFDLGNKSPSIPTPGLQNPEQGDGSPYQWVRDDYVMLHFAAPIGGFNQVSYIDVLDGHVPAALLKGRWVLVGATAEGLGDRLETSASGGNPLMPGVEYQANILESIQDGRLITPLNFFNQLLLNAVLIALPLLLYGLPGFRRLWRVALVALPASLIASLLLLRSSSVWWPPATCLAVTVIGLVACWWTTRFSRRHAER
jgi:CHASE2 domain-containing sensor protein